MNNHVRIGKSGAKTEFRDLARLELETGRPLPAAYRSFLLAHNGGRPTPNLVDIEGADFKGSDIHTFFGFHPENETNDIFSNLDTLEGYTAKEFLPIAYDSFNNLFMLVLDHEDYGHVLYFDSAEIPPRPYHVANDFNEFLGKIRDLTPEELADSKENARVNEDD